MTYRGRFAPSPTGELHIGSAATAIFAYAAALANRGRFILRIEDLDRERVVGGMAEQHMRDLVWLGVRWDEGPNCGGPSAPYEQSQRVDAYEAALQVLAERGLLYFCDCSRAEIARVASAPHVGEEGPRYPGLCREFGLAPRSFRRPPAVRLAVPDGETGRVEFDDGVMGHVAEDVGAQAGDFVLRRGDGVFAYQFAVVVDDLAMGVSEVVRGADLLASTARQVLLARVLGATPPRFAHVPLVVGHAGARLAKRDGGITLRDQQHRGTKASDLVRAVTAAYGIELGEVRSGRIFEALAEALDWSRMGRDAVEITEIV